LALSSSNGITQVFPSSEGSVVEAISNAFNWVGYRGMHLSSAVEAPAYFRAQDSTNGFVLFPFNGPIATVPLRGHPPTVVPYKAIFNITMKAEGARTSVSVRTVFPRVIDGEETGIHGGWAKHGRDVPPVQREEQNVLDAISNALAAVNSKTNSTH
jgi:hypothetical protein